MTTATKVEDKLEVRAEIVNGTIYCVLTKCCSAHDFKNLPLIIRLENQEFKRMSWDSDRYHACYKPVGCYLSQTIADVVINASGQRKVRI